MRYRLRTLLIVITAAAMFFGGYRLGFHHGRSGRFDYLIEQIRKTIKPDSWDGVGGPGAPFEDPFALPAASVEPGDDPFASPEPSYYQPEP
jgi:hypothetical protein